VQKKMSPTEMHAFEKAMMSDPFLADALEGYQNSNADLATQHISEINKKIQPKKESTKVVGMNSSARWLRIAALLIVIVGVGLITYRVLNTPEENADLATFDNMPAPTTDTISAIEQPLAQQQSPRMAIEENAASSSPVINESVTSSGNVAPLAMKESSVDTASFAMRDTNAQLRTLETEKASVASARAPREMSDMMQVQGSSTAQPKDGWVKFQAYVDKEVETAKQKNNAFAGSKVDLEFSVDNNGNVSDIKIINATNTEVAKVAVEILKKSPQWKPLANNARAKISISF
jgi:hypothetical protein